MIVLKIIWISLLVLYALPHVAISQAHYWFMIDPGNEKWFCTPRCVDCFYRSFVPGTIIDGYRVRYFEEVVGGEATILACGLWSNNMEGDVFHHGDCSNPQGAGLFIDSPLWVGKSWQSGTYTTAEVIGQEVFDGPFGDPYVCYVIEYNSLGNITKYWVSDGIGVVKIIVVDGDWEDEIVLCDAVIPTVRSTWGALKGRYR
jgi:hypothetical protein